MIRCHSGNGHFLYSPLKSCSWFTADSKNACKKDKLGYPCYLIINCLHSQPLQNSSDLSKLWLFSIWQLPPVFSHVRHHFKQSFLDSRISRALFQSIGFCDSFSLLVAGTCLYYHPMFPSLFWPLWMTSIWHATLGPSLESVGLDQIATFGSLFCHHNSTLFCLGSHLFLCRAFLLLSNAYTYMCKHIHKQVWLNHIYKYMKFYFPPLWLYLIYFCN